MKDVPAITGFQLIRLLALDGWQQGFKGTHGQALYKYLPDHGRTVRTVVPRTRSRLPSGTLGAILSVKQSGLGRGGLVALIQKYGLK